MCQSSLTTTTIQFEKWWSTIGPHWKKRKKNAKANSIFSLEKLNKNTFQIAKKGHQEAVIKSAGVTPVLTHNLIIS